MIKNITIFLALVLIASCVDYDQGEMLESIEDNVSYAAVQVGEVLVASVETSTDRIGSEISQTTVGVAATLTARLQDVYRAINENRNYLANRIVALETKLLDVMYTLDEIEELLRSCQ